MKRPVLLFVIFTRQDLNQRGCRGGNRPCGEMRLTKLKASDHIFGGDRVARPAKRGQSPLWNPHSGLVLILPPQPSKYKAFRDFWKPFLSARYWC